MFSEIENSFFLRNTNLSSHRHLVCVYYLKSVYISVEKRKKIPFSTAPPKVINWIEIESYFLSNSYFSQFFTDSLLFHHFIFMNLLSLQKNYEESRILLQAIAELICIISVMGIFVNIWSCPRD